MSASRLSSGFLFVISNDRSFLFFLINSPSRLGLLFLFLTSVHVIIILPSFLPFLLHTMTSVIPQPWSNNSIQETGTYPRPDQGPNSFRHQPTNDHSAGHDYRHGHQAYDQQTYSSHSHEQFQSQQERLDLINKEYDQNYSHFYHIPHADSQEREAGDPALAPKSTLPLDQERQRSVTQAGGMVSTESDLQGYTRRIYPTSSLF